MTQVRQPFFQNFKPKFYAAGFAVIFAAMGVYQLVGTHAASIGTMSLSPANAAVSLGSSFTVTITENSSTTAANTVDAELAYDQTKLQYVSTSTTTSAFSSIIATNTGGNGTVSFSAATTSPVTGSQTVAVVTFTAIGTGSAAVDFLPSSGLADAANNSPILGTTTGATYTISDTTAPTVPTGITGSNQAATGLKVNWTASTDNVATTGYKVFRNGTQVGTATTTSYTDTGLTPSTSYSYTVAAYDAAGNASAQSTAVAISTTADTTAPSVPAGLTAGTHALTTLGMSWTASTDNVATTGYKVFRNGTQVGTATTTSYTDTGLTPSTSYSYTVAAYDAAGNASAQSTAVAISTTADTTAPSVPAGLSVSSQTTTGITFKWNASTDNLAVAGYKIFRGGTQIATTASLTYTDSGLAAKTTYSYTVAAYDAAGNTSAQSTVLSVATATLLGDANGDGHIDYLDLSVMAATWQSTTDHRADFNNDGIVNYLDLSVLASKWGSA